MKNAFMSGVLFSVLLLALTAATALAVENDHSYYLQGPLDTGPEVTAKCLKCHEKHANDFMKTTH